MAAVGCLQTPYMMEDRHQMFACVVASMLLLPYLNFGPLLNYTFYILYTLLLVPMLVSYISPSYAITFMSGIFSVIWSLLGSVIGIIRWIFEQRISSFQQNFAAYRIQNVTGQAIFCLMCEKWLCTDTVHLHWIQSFFVSKLVCKMCCSLLPPRNNSMLFPRLPKQFLLHYLFSCGIVVCIVVVLCIHTYVSATCSSIYTTLILVYFIIDSDAFLITATELLETMHLDYLEGLEKYYCAGVSKLLLIILSLVVAVALLAYDQQVGLTFLSLFSNIYVTYSDLMHNVFCVLQYEMCQLQKFRHATQKELLKLNDVCAVCLLPMSSARVLPCKHIFHGRCLRLCLKEKNKCPLCKRLID